MEKYTGRLFPVTYGQLITIVGRAINNPDQIDVQLACGTYESGENVQLHLSVDFTSGEPALIRNSFSQDGGWQNEEREDSVFAGNPLNPVTRGGVFKFSIYVDESAFFISVDEKPFCTFQHRMPIEEIQRVNVARDVEDVFQVNQTTARSNPWPIINTNIFESIVPEQFNCGNVIIITATPKGNPSGSFAVNLYDASDRYSVHYQFRVLLGERRFATKSREIFGEFSPEPFPFNVDEPFKLCIGITDKEFQTAVGGQRLNELPFGYDKERVLGSLVGVEIKSEDGTFVKVQSVDYCRIKECCTGFERFSC